MRHRLRLSVPLTALQAKSTPLPDTGNNSNEASSAESVTVIVVIISIIILAVAVLLWRLYWVHRYRMQQRRQRDDAALLVAARRAAAARAAAEQSAAAEARAEQALEAFDAASVATDSMCAVCLERLDVSCGDVLAAPCMHVLHAHCWRAWLAKDTSRACPICRASVLADDDDDDDEVEIDVGVDVDAFEGQTLDGNMASISVVATSHANTSAPDDDQSQGTQSLVQSQLADQSQTGEIAENRQSGRTMVNGTHSPVRSVDGSVHAISEASGQASSSALPVMPRIGARMFARMRNNDVGNVRHLSLLESDLIRNSRTNDEEMLGDSGETGDVRLAYAVDGRGRRRQLSLTLVTGGPLSNSAGDVMLRRRLMAASTALNRLGSDRAAGSGTSSRQSSVINLNLTSEDATLETGDDVSGFEVRGDVENGGSGRGS